jgi:hypothetical protein
MNFGNPNIGKVFHDVKRNKKGKREILSSAYVIDLPLKCCNLGESSKNYVSGRKIGRERAKIPQPGRSCGQDFLGSYR